MSNTRKINGNTYYVKCNGHNRPLFSWNELPNNKTREQFNYIVDQAMVEHASTDFINDDKRFFNYYGEWYDVGEFETSPTDFKAMGFDGWQTQSYFDAIAIKYFDEFGYELDGVVVAHVHW